MWLSYYKYCLPLFVCIFLSLFYKTNAKHICFLVTMESVSLWWPCSYSNNNNFKFINFCWIHYLALATSLMTCVSCSLKASLTLRKSLMSTLKNTLSSKKIKDSLFLSQIWMPTAQKQSSLKDMCQCRHKCRTKENLKLRHMRKHTGGIMKQIGSSRVRTSLM